MQLDSPTSSVQNNTMTQVSQGEPAMINREKLKAHTKGTTGNTMMENSLLWAPC